MKKALLGYIYILTTIATLFGQGYSAKAAMIYPFDDSAKRIVLTSHVVTITGFSKYSIESKYDVINTSSKEAICIFAFKNNTGDVYKEPIDEAAFVFRLNGTLVEYESKQEEGSTSILLYKCHLNPGKNNIAFTYNDNSSFIDGGANLVLYFDNMALWNISDNCNFCVNIYSESIPFLISPTRDTDSFDVKSIGDTNNIEQVIHDGKKKYRCWSNIGHISLSFIHRPRGLINFSYSTEILYGYKGGAGQSILPSAIPETANDYFAARVSLINTLFRLSQQDNAMSVEESINYCPDEIYTYLKSLKKENLRILRNAFYAYYGYYFGNADLLAFFSGSPLYKPNKSISSTEISFSEKELAIIEAIRRIERE